MVRKHFIHGVGEHAVLTGHTDAIAKLIERGEFSRDELDKVQAAM
jgi:IMP cyclohydrolase